MRPLVPAGARVQKSLQPVNVQWQCLSWSPLEGAGSEASAAYKSKPESSGMYGCTVAERQREVVTGLQTCSDSQLRFYISRFVLET